MRRSLHCGDQYLAREIALETAKFVGRNNNHLIAPMDSHMLRPIAMDTAHQFAEACNSHRPDFTGRLRLQGFEPCSDLILRSALFARVSKDGRLHCLCGHPSRRITLARCSLGMWTGET